MVALVCLCVFTSWSVCQQNDYCPEFRDADHPVRLPVRLNLSQDGRKEACSAPKVARFLFTQMAYVQEQTTGSPQDDEHNNLNHFLALIRAHHLIRKPLLASLLLNHDNEMQLKVALAMRTRLIEAWEASVLEYETVPRPPELNLFSRALFDALDVSFPPSRHAVTLQRDLQSARDAAAHDMKTEEEDDSNMQVRPIFENMHDRAFPSSFDVSKGLLSALHVLSNPHRADVMICLRRNLDHCVSTEVDVSQVFRTPLLLGISRKFATPGKEVVSILLYVLGCFLFIVFTLLYLKPFQGVLWLL